MHGIVGPYVYPLIYCLTTRKSEETYVAILQHLKDQATRFGMNLAPRKIICDFERATMNAIQEIFPEALVIGCLFHWSQSVWRKAVSFGLRTRYNEEIEIKRSINLLLGLPFVPVEDMIEVFLSIEDEIHEDCQGLWTYMDQTWVRGHQARGRRRAVPPTFNPELWNVYQVTLDGQHRTNNAVEAWHSKFAKHVNTHHANIWKFINKLQKEQQENSNQFIQIRGGHRNIRHPVNRTYLTQQRQIEAIVGDYNTYKSNDELPQYLVAIAYKLKLPDI